MRLALGMDVSRLFRSRARVAGAAVCAAALAAAVTSCSATEKLTTGLQVKRSVEKLGDKPAATVLVRADASQQEAHDFLRAASGGSAGGSLQERARLLSTGELTFAVGSEEEKTALADLSKSERLNVAAALNFGGKDTVAAKSVAEQLYVRVNLRSVAHHFESAQLDAGRADRLVALADRLPATLGSAKDALRGKWVRVDPDAFDAFVAAAQQMREAAQAPAPSEGERAGQGREKSPASGPPQEFARATALGSALAGQSEREFLDGLQETLAEHATFAKAGERDGAEHVTASMPGRETARDLSRALTALGIRLDPSTVPDEQITADLEIRRGQLTGMTLDAGQFLPPQRDAEPPPLPMEFDFGGGDAIPTLAPDGARTLQPQDLLAAVVYGALGTGRL